MTKVTFTKRDHATATSIFQDHPDSGERGRMGDELAKRNGEIHQDMDNHNGTKTKSMKMVHSIIQDHPNYHGDFDGEGMGFPHSSHLRSFERKISKLKEETMNEELEDTIDELETETGFEADESEEAVETDPTAKDALNALLDDNLLGFNEIMADLITSRAADYVNATREVLAQNAFNLGAVENDGEEEDDSEFIDDEETTEETPNEE